MYFVYIIVVFGLMWNELTRPTNANTSTTKEPPDRTRFTSAPKNSTPTSEINPNLVAPSEPFKNSLIFIEPDIVLLYWSFNSSHILFEVHAKTNGWVSFGLQSKSLTDFVLGFVNDDGSAYFSDQHRWTIDAFNMSEVDAKQDWTPLYLAKTKGYTVMKFIRPINGCGVNQADVEDLDVPVNSNVTLVCSIGEVFNGQVVYYEIQKRQKDVKLINVDPHQVAARVNISLILFSPSIMILNFLFNFQVFLSIFLWE